MELLLLLLLLLLYHWPFEAALERAKQNNGARRSCASERLSAFSFSDRNYGPMGRTSHNVAVEKLSKKMRKRGYCNRIIRIWLIFLPVKLSLINIKHISFFILK